MRSRGPGHGVDLQAYKRRKEEQLQRAQTIRDQRNARLATDSPVEPQKHMDRSSTPPLPTLVHHPVPGATTENYTDQSPYPHYTSPVYTSGPSVTPHGNGITTHHHPSSSSSSSSDPSQNDNWAAVQQRPMFRADSAKQFSGSGSKLLLGEQDIAGAVSTGILTMDQAGKLWKFLLKSAGGPHSEPSSPHDGINFSVPQVPSHAALHAAPRSAGASTGRVQHAEVTDHYDDVVVSSRQTTTKTKNSGKPEWNMDTDVNYEEGTGPSYQDPHDEPSGNSGYSAPAHAQRRKPSGSRPSARDHKPDFVLDAGEGDGGFGEPPPLPNRKPTQQRTTTRPKPTQKQGGRPSYAQQYAEQINNYSDMGSDPYENASAPPSERRHDPLATLKARHGNKQRPISTGSDYNTTNNYQGSYATQQQPQHHHHQQEPIHQTQMIEYEEQRQQEMERRNQVVAEGHEAEEDIGPMSQCGTCGRTFRQDRLAKHEAVCAKVFASKRKVFDVKAQRQEREAKQFERGGAAGGGRQRHGGAHPKTTEKTPLKKMPKWKAQHAELQAAMRNARGAPPPSEGGGGYQPPAHVDTRVECPHCGRRFADDVAERHIPKCKNTVHKPRMLVRKK